MQAKVRIWGVICALLATFWTGAGHASEGSLVFEPSGSANGKHIVLLSGDEEYRSEESLPMLAKILSQRHGFKCTVLFSVDPDGTINPNRQESLTDASALDHADAIIMALRYRQWPDADMKHFVDAYRRGVPIIGLRTSTHAFNFSGNSQTSYRDFNKFGKRVLGEEWVTHWGRHKSEATRGIIEQANRNHPILRGVEDVFGNTDVYEAYPPADATILLRGAVLAGMNPSDPKASYTKKRATDRQEQDVNDPMMAVAWAREYKNEAGKENRVFCTTMGSATDLQNEGLRRAIVNAVYWGLRMDVPSAADVRLVDEYHPTMYGFNGFVKGKRPSDYALQKSAASANASGMRLHLQPEEHVAILGNALPDRMQHEGFLETLIHAHLPDHHLVFRNLSKAGDEVNTWFRSENFGERDDWLKKVQADVIFAFYGFPESFEGEEGVAQFKANLDQFIKQTQANNYSGRGNPRLVLFSPAADEKHPDPNFPDPSANNQRLAAYTQAMAQVAADNGVLFVNLFEPSLKLYQEAAARGEALTVNGHYLNERAYGLLAPIVFEQLFGERPPTGDFSKLRAAVNEKNEQWHHRYRTIDGYNVYGGRSALAYQPGKTPFISDRTPPEPFVSNYKVMQEEMSQRDVMTANRDKKVWAAARGQDYTVDDSNLPPVTKVQSNLTGPNTDGSFEFLSGEEAISKMTLHSGMKVNLFADEAMFPELAQPVQMAWDTRGRLWVAAWPNYPERTPTSAKGDSLLVFEDTNGDGKADKMTTFIDDLNAPTGFQFYRDGVLVMQAPDLWFVKDTDGDGRADYRERVLMGLDSADSHHTANAICLDPGGAIYLSDGVFHRTQVETAYGVTRNRDAAIYRFEPRTGKFETYISYGFANPHGRVFDYWGNDFVTDATGNNTYFGPAFSGYLDFDKGKHPGMKQFWERPSRPCPGTGILSSRHFPPELQGNFLNLNVISFRGIYNVKVSDDGSGLKGETQEDIISSSDPNFRPVAVSIGPDGAIYFLDWQNPIIGHMQHHLRDPNRDKKHGRIYRITYEGRPLLEQPKIDGASIPALLDLLKEPENQTRTLAKVELGNRDTREVISGVKQWISKLDKNDPDYEHQMMEALWVHQWMNVVDADLLKRMLRSSEPHARAAAGRVLCYWRDRVSDSLNLFRALAEDENPRVRLEAVRAASFYRSPAAAEMALLVLKRPMDYYLNYTLNETLRQLEPYWRKAIAEGMPLAKDNPAGIDRLVSSLSTAELERVPRTDSVLVALLTRPGVDEATRLIALDDLAKQRRSNRAKELLQLVDSLDSGDTAKMETLARLVTMMSPDELKSVHAEVAKLARDSRVATLRRSAWAALAVEANSFENLWAQAGDNPEVLADIVSAVPLVLDQQVRNSAAAKIEELVKSRPAASNDGMPPKARFVRIELPRVGTLTLAEVQVFSGGRNIARSGKARQSSTEHGGAADRAIDGRTDGDYNSGTQTHTREQETNPWWEVDLGSDQPIEKIVVWNRGADGQQLAQRLDGFTLSALTSNRSVAFKKTGIAAPPEKVEIPVSSADPRETLRAAAIAALVAIPSEQPTAFTTLSALVRDGRDVPAAARAVRSLPRDAVPKDEAGQTASALIAWAKNIPESDRTSPDYVQTIQAADDLAGLLPAARAIELRRQLKDLRVAVFVVQTVREQMRFDTTRLVVEAGKPVQIIVQNMDFMPHNFVVVRPGTREQVGGMTEHMKPDRLDNQGRAFMPRSRDIVAGTRLLESGQSQTLEFSVPDSEGIYEFVCTFPGHWQVMFGQFVVTKDVDAYLAKNPQSMAPTASAAHHDHQKSTFE